VFRVKICGIRDLTDLSAAIAARADAIGLNFYPGSKRHIEMEAAQEISHAAKTAVLRVGLFVNTPINKLREMCSIISFDAIQVHGDEDEAWFRQAKLLKKPVIRAIRCPESPEALRAEIDRVRSDRGLYAALLIDGAAAGKKASETVYGGSGAVANWQWISEIRDSIDVPLILAGGLTPENVAGAIKLCRPDGVDVAGGVEGDSGKKDANKTRAFAEAAKTALAAVAKETSKVLS
jgi:phosphoribosylanthranilate isomerase